TRLGTIRDTDKLASWLFGIARFVFLEQLRARKSLGAPTRDPEMEAEQADGAPTPEGALLSREADQLLDQALSRLSEQRRSALLLRIDHGMGYEDIAEIMDWPVAKVKNEIHRARLQLRSHQTKYIGGTL